MLDKDKWKTFPCKECLIRKVCKQDCFICPEHDHLKKYVEDNLPKNTCLGCGFEINLIGHNVWCELCSGRKYFELK